MKKYIHLLPLKTKDRNASHFNTHKSSRSSIEPVILESSQMKKEMVFSIPEKLQNLEKCFQALECTMTFMNGRDQQVIFHKIQKAVQSITNK